ncbi:hypothetical protein LWL40_27550 (plasmid) [Bacillus thuringiensis]|uniref:hypothetical protein n=1 Tax=Bacillus thuringiensis TaxID=1428 RepID=UPI003D75282F
MSELAIKQHSFKCNSENPDEKMISEFLEGKPTQYHIIEAMKIYVRIEGAKQKAINGMISNIENGLFSKPSADQQRKAEEESETPKSKNDDIKEFEL